jgi:hypothetical protein
VRTAKQVFLRSALLALMVVIPRVGRADATAADRATARVLMDDGDRMLARHDADGALNAYVAADAIMHVPSTSIAVARALESSGRLLDARDKYLSVMRSVAQAGEPVVFTAARKEAAERATAIEAVIPILRFDVSSVKDRAALSLKVDDGSVPSAAFGLPRQVNPGEHVVIATEPGFDPFTQTITLAARETRTVVITLKTPSAGAHAETNDPGRAPSGATTEPSNPDNGGSKRPHSEPNQLNTSRSRAGGYPTWGWAGVAAGGAGLVVGSVFGGLSLGNASKAKAYCDAQNQCTPAAVPFIASSKTQATISTVSFVIALAGGGVALAALFGGDSIPHAGTDKRTSGKPRGSAAFIAADLSIQYVGVHGAF